MKRDDHLTRAEGFRPGIDRALGWLFGLVCFAGFGMGLEEAFGLEAVWVARLVGMTVILLSAWVVLRCAQERFGRAGGWRFCLVLLVVGASAEVAGVYTGLPFGDYRYTREWWPTVTLPGGEPYPLLLPIAWVMVAGSSILLVQRWWPGVWGVLGGAALATLVDVPMEMAMSMLLRYWEWAEYGPVFGAPLMNSAGWFVVSLVGGLLGWAGLSTAVTRGRRREAVVLGCHLLLTGAVILFKGKIALLEAAGTLFAAGLLFGVGFADERRKGVVDSE